MKRVVKALKADIKDEAKARKSYLKLAKSSDPKTARMVRSIAKDEQEHHARLVKRVKALAKKNKKSKR